MLKQEQSVKKYNIQEDILIIEENTIYEIDINCMECKKEKERQEKEKKDSKHACNPLHHHK